MHVYITRDIKFTGTYAGKTAAGKSVVLHATVEAPDAYAAGDKLRSLAEKRFGGPVYYPVVRWSKGASRLSEGSISQRVSLNAGAEEDKAFIK